MLRHDQAIEPIAYDCHKGSFFVTSCYSIKNGSFEFHRNSIEHTSKRWALTFTEFTWNPLIELLPLANFLEMIRYCWNADTHCLRHIYDILTWVLFNKCFQMLEVNCGWTSSTLLIFKIRFSATELLKPAPYCPITSRSFYACSVDIGSCLKSILTKLEIMQKKSKCLTSFFLVHD